MMASHRPADNPPPPPPPEAAPDRPSPTIPPGGPTTLPESGFLVGFDWVLSLGVLALAFFLASFAARNSDLWLHLAVGRLLAAGEYSFGTDPFSYVGADRAWVNHAWLFDWLLYQLYKLAGGPGLVIAKAVALVLTAGLLLAARRPGQSLFPAVVCTGLALLAAAPRLLLQPTVASFLALAVLLALLIRVPRRPGSWAFPLAVAGLFWAWANCDQWFFLGPALLLLYTAGQYLRPDEGEDRGTLWRAVGLGVVACMLNPHHVRVWTLPPEAFDARLAETFGQDPEFAAMFVRGWAAEAWDFSTNPVNATALLLLVVLTAAGFLVNRRHASAGLGLMVLGAAAVAALHMRAIPFFALVAAPVAAVNLAAAGQRLAARPLTEGTVRTLHALRAAGRGVVGLAGLVLIAATYAGWAHPPGLQARWKWDVEPSQSLVRAAERIHRWRTDGTLPPTARLLNLQPDFANYVAWFAPGEKTFFDYRFAFHRPEAVEYVALRQYLRPRDPQERRQDPFDLSAFLRKYDVTYAVSAHPRRVWNQAAVDALWADDPGQPGGPDWALWHVEGRAVILGWTRQEAIPPSAFDRLRFDPLRAAYAEAALLPVPEVRPPAPPRELAEKYITPPPVAPPEGEEAFVLMKYRQSLITRMATRHRYLLEVPYLLAQTRLQTPALTYWTVLPLREGRLLPPTLPPEASAVALLAVRSGRKAVATSPDHPDGYYFLARAYMDSSYFMTPELQEVVTTVNLTRCQARLGEDPTARRGTIDLLDLCDQLDNSHAGARPMRLDLRLRVTELAIGTLQAEVDFLEDESWRLTGEARDQAEKELERKRRILDTEERRLKDGRAELQKATDRYVNEAAVRTSPLERAALARRTGLHQEAVKELRKAHEQFQKQLGEEKKKFTSDELAQQFVLHAELIELLMFDGHVEEAAQILDTFDTADTRALMRDDGVRRAHLGYRRRLLSFLNPQRPFSPHDGDPAGHFRALRLAVALGVGDYLAAIEAQKAEIETLHRDLAAYKAVNFPPGVTPTGPTLDPFAMMMDQLCAALANPLNPVAGHLAGIGRVLHSQNVEQLRGLAYALVSAHLNMALIQLEYGDVPAAAHHFRQALNSPEFPDPLPGQRLAKQYLAAIDKATGGRGADR